MNRHCIGWISESDIVGSRIATPLRDCIEFLPQRVFPRTRFGSFRFAVCSSRFRVPACELQAVVIANLGENFCARRSNMDKGKGRGDGEGEKRTHDKDEKRVGLFAQKDNRPAPAKRCYQLATCCVINPHYFVNTSLLLIVNPKPKMSHNINVFYPKVVHI